MVKNMMKIILFVTICIMLTSCEGCKESWYDTKALTYKDKFVFNNQFRMDGIYFKKREDVDGYYIMCFFQNGYFLRTYYSTDDFFYYNCLQLNSYEKILLVRGVALL